MYHHHSAWSRLVLFATSHAEGVRVLAVLATGAHQSERPCRPLVFGRPRAMGRLGTTKKKKSVLSVVVKVVVVWWRVLVLVVSVPSVVVVEMPRSY